MADVTLAAADGQHPVHTFTPVAPVPRPPSPPNFIFLRSLQILPTLVRNPLEGFSVDAFTDPIAFSKMFHRPIMLIHDPALIRAFHVDNVENYKVDPVRQSILRPALRDGLLTAEGDLWKRSRRALAPVFAPRHVDGFAPAMASHARAFAQDLAAKGGTHSIAETMSALAYRVLSATLFSGEIDGDAEEVLADVSRFLEHLGHPDPVDFLTAPDWVPRLTKLKGHSALRRLRTNVNRLARNRRERMNAGEDVPQDFLTLLLQAGENDDGGLTLDEVEDNIITFIAAGHETTARALAWTLYLLSKDHGARDRCETEADAVDTEQPPENWAEQAPFITACFEESLRLYPPAPMIARQVTEHFTLHGKEQDYQPFPGLAVITSPYVLHRHETLWERPNTFDPSRFMGDARKSIDRFAYLPFGMGPRICIGQRFAMQEAVIILVELLRAARFDYAADKEPWPLMRITIQPDNGMPMRVSAR